MDNSQQANSSLIPLEWQFSLDSRAACACTRWDRINDNWHFIYRGRKTSFVFAGDKPPDITRLGLIGLNLILLGALIAVIFDLKF